MQFLDELYARWRASDGTSWYLQDRMFSVRDVVDLHGVSLDHIEYDLFGTVLSESNAAAGDRYKYTGREYDSATGLYHYRARAYDPASKRFLQQDPIGFAAGDTNLYRYAFDAPTMYRDPSGHSALVEYATAMARIALQILGDQDVKVCMSEESTRLVYTASLGVGGWGVEATFGVVISTYGLPVPRIAQMAFCVESCAQLGITAYANGIFGVVAMSVDYFNQLNAKGGDSLAVEIEYAEPEAAGDKWKLRVSLSCGRKKLQGMGDARGPQVGDVTGSVGPSNSSESGRNTGSTESGAENGAKYLANLRKRIRSLKWRLKRSINQGAQNKHIENTHENKQARAMKKDPKSTWDNSAEVNGRTVEAWVHGTLVRGDLPRRKFNFGRRVGTARDGCGNARHGQSHVTTQMANGGMHRTLSGPPV